MIDFSNCKLSGRYYDQGLSGRKLGVIYNDENYMLKFRGSLKTKKYEHLKLSYNNNAFSEYIGSHVYEILGFDVHKTLLGAYDGKIVVACKDFRNDSAELIHFSGIKNAYIEIQEEADKINNIIKIINDDKLLSSVDGLKEHFYDMMIIDFLIGNPDRNNGNWGLLKENGRFKLCPVFDNGNALNNFATDEQLAEIIKDEDKMDYELRNFKSFWKDDSGKSIDIYEFINDKKNVDMTDALKRNVANIDLKIKDIDKFIDECSDISQVRKIYYKKVLNGRFEKLKSIM